MKKCTLCVDRIYNEHIPEESRQPACVRACPTRARHFGDLGDPSSEISLLVAAREGRDLMPELGYQPVNKYLPPRPRRASEGDVPADAMAVVAASESLDTAQLNPLLRWLDRALSR
jgi:Fe-S-cluster-containing dehydrogenase component